MKSQTSFSKKPKNTKDIALLWRIFRVMSPKAKLQTMIDAGILTSELTLTERYQSSSSEEAGDKENSAGSSLPQKKATQS